MAEGVVDVEVVVVVDPGYGDEINPRVGVTHAVQIVGEENTSTAAAATKANTDALLLLTGWGD